MKRPVMLADLSPIEYEIVVLKSVWDLVDEMVIIKSFQNLTRPKTRNFVSIVPYIRDCLTFF